MSIITIPQLEQAINVTFDTGQVGQVQFLIDGLTDVVYNYTGIWFGTETNSFTMQANMRGTLKLKWNPMVAVNSITDILTTTIVDPTTYFYNNFNKICGLHGGQRVTVNVSYGVPEAEIPPAVRMVGLSALQRGLTSITVPNLTQRQVGDVIYSYGAMLPLTAQEIDVLNSLNSDGGQGSLGLFDTDRDESTLFRWNPDQFPTPYWPADEFQQGW